MGGKHSMNGSRRNANSENHFDRWTNGKGKYKNRGAMTEIKTLPIWTLGDPHNASRHKSVTTNSSFMVVLMLLTRRHSSLRQRFLPKHHLHHTQCEFMAWFQVRSEASRALRMPYPLFRDARVAAAAGLRARAVDCLGIPMRHEKEPRAADS